MEEQAERDDGPTAVAARQFDAAVRRGNLEEASDVLDRFLTEVDAGGSGGSLLERAAPARRALNAGDLDRAAVLLASWEARPPDTTSHGPERLAQLPNLNTLGMLLIDYFSYPGCVTHSRYDELMEGQLANVARWTRLSSPVPTPGGFFDRAYANIKSSRELLRASERTGNDA